MLLSAENSSFGTYNIFKNKGKYYLEVIFFFFFCWCGFGNQHSGTSIHTAAAAIFHETGRWQAPEAGRGGG